MTGLRVCLTEAVDVLWRRHVAAGDNDLQTGALFVAAEVRTAPAPLFFSLVSFLAPFVSHRHMFYVCFVCPLTVVSFGIIYGLLFLALLPKWLSQSIYYCCIQTMWRKTSV